MSDLMITDGVKQTVITRLSASNAAIALQNLTHGKPAKGAVADVLSLTERLEHWAGAVWSATSWRQRQRTLLVTHSRLCRELQSRIPPHKLTAPHQGPATPSGSKLPPFLPSARRRATLSRRSKRGLHADSRRVSMTSPSVKFRHWRAESVVSP